MGGQAQRNRPVGQRLLALACEDEVAVPGKDCRPPRQGVLLERPRTAYPCGPAELVDGRFELRTAAHGGVVDGLLGDSFPSVVFVVVIRAARRPAHGQPCVKVVAGRGNDDQVGGAEDCFRSAHVDALVVLVVVQDAEKVDPEVALAGGAAERHGVSDSARQYDLCEQSVDMRECVNVPLGGHEGIDQAPSVAESPVTWRSLLCENTADHATEVDVDEAEGGREFLAYPILPASWRYTGVPARFIVVIIAASVIFTAVEKPCADSGSIRGRILMQLHGGRWRWRDGLGRAVGRLDELDAASEHLAIRICTGVERACNMQRQCELARAVLAADEAVQLTQVLAADALGG